MAFSLVACTEEGGKTPENPDSGTTQPDDGNGNGEGETKDPVQLIAPVISLNDGVISWSAVAHASAYEVYENDSLARRQTATTYTVTKTAAGEYVYKVRAISSSSSYTTSEFSNTETYTVEPKVEPAVPLTAPVITLTEKQITWSAVANATAYEIYENGVKVGQVKTTSYTITNTLAGEWNYTVVAISSDTEHYSPSEPSNTVTYTVTATVVNYVITVTVPSGYSAPVQVALYKQGETTPVETKSVTVSGGQGRVEFTQSNEHVYTASVVNVATGYTATTARLTASNTNGAIKILKLDGNDMFKLGKNSFTVANNNDAIGADKFFYFVAGESGTYTIDCSAETKDMYLSINGTLYIDVKNEQYYATFHAEAGELFEICVVGHESGTFNFEIVEGEIKQYFRIGAEYGMRPNYVYADCTRYLTVTTPGYYIFECSFATLSGKSLTLTVNGVDYFFGDGEEEGEAIHMLQIPLNSGEHTFTVKVDGIVLDGPDVIPFVAFFIYPAE